MLLDYLDYLCYGLFLGHYNKCYPNSSMAHIVHITNLLNLTSDTDASI